VKHHLAPGTAPFGFAELAQAFRPTGFPSEYAGSIPVIGSTLTRVDTVRTIRRTFASMMHWIRSVVITPAGDQNLSVGMNLKEIAGSLGDPARLDEIFDQRLRVLSAIENMDKPRIATLIGNCLGRTGTTTALSHPARRPAGAKIGPPKCTWARDGLGR
jgi:hypothetical protein